MIQMKQLPDWVRREASGDGEGLAPTLRAASHLSPGYSIARLARDGERLTKLI